jgi:hypothetical protein
MAIDDKYWEINRYLKDSTQDKIIGCIKFLHEKAEERKNELRLSR